MLKTPKLNTNGTYNRSALANGSSLEHGERRIINVITEGHNYRSIGTPRTNGRSVSSWNRGICKSRDTNSISSEASQAAQAGGLMQVADKKLDGPEAPTCVTC